MTQETYGRLWRDTDVTGATLWKVECRPQVAITLKAVFARCYKGNVGELMVHDTDEVRRNLIWFMDRYPLETSKADLADLKSGAKRHKDLVLTVGQMIDPDYKARDFALAKPLRMYQRQAADVFLKVRALLLADDVGLGKTITTIAALSEARALPAVIVTPANTMPQHWEAKLREFLPGAVAHIVRTGKPYELPKFMGRGPDVVILNYHKLAKWSTVLKAYGKTVVFDECQELRRTESQKYAAAEEIAAKATYRLGLSATPIYNMGFEIWNVMNVLAPGVLGHATEFSREWCSGGEWLKDAKALGAYLREQGLMVRRTRAEVGRELPPVTKVVQTVEMDEEPLEEVASAAEALARIILSQVDLGRGDAMRAAGELDWKLRQATGVGKAPHVADFVRMLVENGEKVVVFGWHRAFYEIVQERLKDYNPAMFTGEETQAEKIESKRRFVEGETPVLLMSLRAGAGLDGFQDVCRTVVFGELDWSPGVHEQCVGRVARDGQKDPTTVYFLVAEDGSDPVVSEKLGMKRVQIEGIKNPTGEMLEDMQAATDKARSLARHFLKRMGKLAPELEDDAELEKAEGSG